MIEGISVALKSYYDVAVSAKQILEDAIEQIGQNYIGALYAEKTKEAKDIYNTTMSDCKKENYDACITILNEVADNARKVVEMPVPTDFVSTLEALKQIDNPTRKEVTTVVGAYKNNYFAYRAICDYLGGAVNGFKPVTIDDIEQDIADVRTNIHACFFRDNIDGYHFMNWMNGTIIASYDEMFTAFIDGRFEDILAHDSEDDSEGAEQ